MDTQINSRPSLIERDLALLDRIETGLTITADVSRSDVMLCRLTYGAHPLSTQNGQRKPSANMRILVARHVAPYSLSSIYMDDITGRAYTPDARPTVYRALVEARACSKVKRIRSNGAPVIQQVYPICNADHRPIAALLIETSMIEYERHRRRDPPFRQAVRWLQRMAVRGEIEVAEIAGRFGSLDGVYLVDEQLHINYMSEIAMNLFRSIGLATGRHGSPISNLEEEDERVVNRAMQANYCVQTRHESKDGRVWTRTAIPLRAPHCSLHQMRKRMRRRFSRSTSRPTEGFSQVDSMLVILHNATEKVQRERALNIRSTMIREVHHRVKNNLQTIAAVLRIQGRRSQNGETRQHLADAVNRILSMSVVHEYLSQDEHRLINIHDICQRILEEAQQVAVNPEQFIEVAMSGPNIRLPAGQATAAALVVNELLMNAIEHGVREREQGKVGIALEDLGDAVRITVLDNGLGLPYDFVPDQSHSLGLQIVQTLVTDDLKGDLLIKPASEGNVGAEPLCDSARSGTRAVITFPKRSINVESVVA